MDYAALRQLIETNPDFTTLSDDQLAAWVNDEVVSIDKTSLPNTEILAVILANRAEFAALSDTNKQIVRDILYVGDSVPTSAGEPARDTLVAIFGGGSATIQSLASAISETVSRAVAAGIIGRVTAGDVQFARTFGG